MGSREDLKKSKRIIIKIGTTSLTYPNGKMNYRIVRNLCSTLTNLRNQGRDVIFVSSGAIAVGADRLELSERPRDIVGKQAASAVGQAVLIQIYENFFMEYNQKVAQILLTRDVFEDETRRTHAKNTFEALLQMGIIPIVNENDTVSVDELGFSDNDALSAYVSCLVEGDCLIILSDIDGLYDSNPRENPDAKLISYVECINKNILTMAGEAGSNLGTGGMASKIMAAKLAGTCKINTVIALGENPEILFDILDGKDIGTYIKGGLK